MTAEAVVARGNVGQLYIAEETSQSAGDKGSDFQSLPMTTHIVGLYHLSSKVTMSQSPRLGRVI